MKPLHPWSLYRCLATGGPPGGQRTGERYVCYILASRRRTEAANDWPSLLDDEDVHVIDARPQFLSLIALPAWDDT